MNGDPDREKDREADGDEDLEESSPSIETTEMARLLELSPDTLRQMKHAGSLKAAKAAKAAKAPASEEE